MSKKPSRKQIVSDLLSPYKEMFSWLNSFTISFLRRDSSSSISSSLPMESILAAIDNLAPEKVERNVRDNAGPFFYKGNDIGVILVHGFSSTAQEMMELGQLLHEKFGYSTFGVLLAGHGTSPADLALTDMLDWYKSVKESYDFIKQYCKKIILIGHSMGATLSLILAAHESVDAVVTLCAPIKVEYFMQDYIFLVADLLKYFPRRKKEIELMEKNSMLNYRVSALKAVEHMLDLMEVAREEIQNVTAPIFTVTAGLDDRVPLYNAEKIHELVKSEIKEDYFAANSIHTILFGSEKQQVTERIIQFIESILNTK
ncbi:MAG: alpha/beta fold hydrolase [Candidatus Heimdallarchaeota archaeon]|nr:alpha/beta fold hydrolase [Candidatus Heimdallarchaeota archaeon]MBY8993735.1 alpha/beta fold hydrolase [Candidatus Heimdallarchaeota archaeon]